MFVYSSSNYMLFGFVIKSVSFKMLDLWLKFIQSILFPLTQFCHTILVHAHPKFSLSLGPNVHYGQHLHYRNEKFEQKEMSICQKNPIFKLKQYLPVLSSLTWISSSGDYRNEHFNVQLHVCMGNEWRYANVVW